MPAPVYYVSPRFGALSLAQMLGAAAAERAVDDLARAGMFPLPAVIGHSRPMGARAVTPAG